MQRSEPAPGDETREARKLEFLLKIVTGLALAGGVFEFAASYWKPEEHTRPGAIIAIVVSSAMFVRWSRLPFLSKHLDSPGMYLSVLSKLVLGMAVGFVPFLVVHAQYAAAAGAIVFGIASLGLWLRWWWVAWIWYVLLLASFWAMARSLWSLAEGEVAGIWIAFHAIPHVFSCLMWLVFFFELVQWQRDLARERSLRPQPATAAAPSPTTSTAPPATATATSDRSPDAAPESDAPAPSGEAAETDER